MTPLPPDPRVYFAAERTLLAWVRTAINLVGLGFVVARFGLFLRLVDPEHPDLPRTGLSAMLGSVMVLAGGAFCAVAAFNFARFFRSLKPEELPRPAHSAMLTLVLSLSVTAVALVLGVYLL